MNLLKLNLVEEPSCKPGWEAGYSIAAEMKATDRCTGETLFDQGWNAYIDDQAKDKTKSKLKAVRVKVDDGCYAGREVWTTPYACTSVETCGFVTVLRLNGHIVWSGRSLEVDINTLS